MGKAEAGSTKFISNQMKQKGLTRLRFYCQVCERGMRDENSFKQHTLSESHVRKMLIIGEDPKKAIKQFSDQFLRDFVSLLKTSHGEKKIHINHFYQEYIGNKDHLHMNATQWSSLSEFAKHLGREGICRVEDTEKGLHISWIDNSPEALRRQQALKRKAALEQGDEELEQRLINEQIKRAKKAAEERGGLAVKGAEEEEEQEDDERHALKRKGDEKISLALGLAGKKKEERKEEKEKEIKDKEKIDISGEQSTNPPPPKKLTPAAPPPAKAGGFGGMNLKVDGSPKPKNVFAQKKNALGGAAKKVMAEQPKKMSEAERIMKEEMERKRGRESGGGPAKKMKFSLGGK